jgi:hypothetical protein
MSLRNIRFSGFSEKCSVWGHYVLFISLGFLGHVEHWGFIDNPCVIPLDRATCLHSRLNIKYISSIWSCTMLILVTLFLFDFMRVATFDLALTFTLRRMWLRSTSHRMINLYFCSPSHFISWFNRDWHLVICDSSWLAWFLRLNVHLPFSITSDFSMSRLLLALLWFMVHHD